MEVFMPRGYQVLRVDKAAVLAGMKEAKTVEEFQRYQAIHLRVSENLEVGIIARITGLAESTIHNLHSRCRSAGLEAAKTKGKGGRYHAHMTEAEEKAFIAPFIATARKGGIIEVGGIHHALEQRLGKTLNRQVVYNLLHRHGWRKIAPRPKHPKGDAKAQEAFKKTGLRSSKQQSKKPTRQASR
jgi:transposase